MKSDSLSYHVPTEVYLETGAIKRIGEIAKRYGEKVLIVSTSRTLEREGVLARIADLLHDAGVRSRIETKVSPDPKDFEIAGILDRRTDETVIIGIGGGSSIDASKAVAASIGLEMPASDLYDVSVDKALPVIAVPTTAGSGSEVSKGAIITDSENETKRGIRGPGLAPKVALIDPELTLSLPWNVTRDSGFDVLCHALESAMNVRANDLSFEYSREAFRIAWNTLPLLEHNGNDIELRRAMSYASLLAGFNLANVGTAIPHRLQYPLGGKYAMSHAEGLAMIYPHWLKGFSTEADRRLEFISSSIGINSAELMKRSLESLIERLGFADVRSRGGSADDMGLLISRVGPGSESDISYDPGAIERIYRGVLG